MKLIFKSEYGSVEFKKIIRHSISEQKCWGIRQIKYWLCRGYTRKQSKNKISEVQKKNYKKIEEKYSSEELYILRTKGNKNRTKQDYRNSSIRCEEYWLLKGFTKEEAKEKIRKVCDTSLNKMTEKYGKEEGPKRYKNKIKNTKKSSKRCVEYWIENGCTIEEAQKEVSKYQVTFSKELCIEKYGKKEGIKVWQKRQDKWQKTMKNKSDEEIKRINRSKMHNFNGFSLISQKLFWSLTEQLESLDDVYFATLNENKKKDPTINNEYIILTKEKRCFFIDFLVKNKKKAIEFNGSYWHGCPKIYKKNDILKFPNKNIKVKNLWEKDKIKIDAINKKGFDVLTIWENDYRNDPEKTINECLNFLNS